MHGGFRVAPPTLRSGPALMAQETVVIVGAGHGGFQLAASLRQHGFDGRILLLTEEPVLPYQRPPLSKDYLDGKIGFDLLLMRPDAFYRDHGIDLLQGAPADPLVLQVDRSITPNWPTADQSRPIWCWSVSA